MMKNSHQVYELGYHIIFCTKYRHKVLDGDVAVACRNSIAETCAAYGWGLEEIEVMPDHVHMFVTASPQTTPAEIARTVKSISAVRIFTQFPKLKGRKFWEADYGHPAPISAVSDTSARKPSDDTSKHRRKEHDGDSSPPTRGGESSPKPLEVWIACD